MKRFYNADETIKILFNRLQLSASEIIILFIFSLIILFSGFSVWSINHNNYSESYTGSEYRYAAEQFKEDLAYLLEQSGYTNCGINLTRIVTPINDNNGTEEYETYECTVEIYHNKLKQLNMAEESELMTEIVKLEFPLDYYTIRYRLQKT